MVTFIVSFRLVDDNDGRGDSDDTNVDTVSDAVTDSDSTDNVVGFVPQYALYHYDHSMTMINPKLFNRLVPLMVVITMEVIPVQVLILILLLVDHSRQ